MASFSFSRKLYGIMSPLCMAIHAIVCAGDADIDSPSQAILNFQEAYDYTIEYAMKIKSAQAEVGIRQAEQLQVGLYPNPQLNISVDGPSNSYNLGSNNNDISIGLTQLFELGGKRRARVRVAEAAGCETSWDLEILKCDLYVDLMHAFINAAAAQERLAITEELQTLSAKSLQCICDKAAHGKTAALDIKKAEIALKTAALARNKQAAEVEKAKIQLVALWNSNTPAFQRVDYPLSTLEEPLPFDHLVEELQHSPVLARSHAELSKAWEVIELERSRRIPDATVYVGVCTERNFHDPALSVGLTIPLPIFDRNQGNITRASHAFNQISFKQNDLINELQSRLKVIYREWVTAYHQAVDTQEIMEGAASEAYRLAEQSYSLGNSEFLDFLEAAISLFTIKQQHLDAVEEYHHKRAEMLKLLAKCCSEALTT